MRKSVILFNTTPFYYCCCCCCCCCYVSWRTTSPHSVATTSSPRVVLS